MGMDINIKRIYEKKKIRDELKVQTWLHHIPSG